MGVIAYEFLTRELPYERADHVGTITAILSAELVPPSKQNSDLPIGLDEIVLTAMANDKTDRYESALYFRDALRGVKS